MLSLAEIGYAAGFYEGEGSFIYVKGSELGCYVNITQKDPWPLVRLQKSFGGKINTYGGYNYWRLHGVEARSFILTIFTLLSPRRREQILKHKGFFTTIDSCPNGHPYVIGSYKMEMSRGKEVRVCLECRKAHNLRRDHNRSQWDPGSAKDKLIGLIAKTNKISIVEAEARYNLMQAESDPKIQ